MLPTVLLLLLGSTCLPVAVKGVPLGALPYHQLMSPKWLNDNADFTGSHALTPQYLEILPSTTDWQQALQVQLVEPNVLTSTACITVTMTIAMNTTLADEEDHDPSFGISDGNSFVGFFIADKINYHNRSPCRKMEGENINGTLQNRRRGLGPLVASRLYSSEVRLQIRPTEQWGSCHTEHDEGYTNIGNYERTPDFTNGLYLELYHQNKEEDYQIKYIVVDVTLD